MVSAAETHCIRVIARRTFLHAKVQGLIPSCLLRGNMQSNVVKCNAGVVQRNGSVSGVSGQYVISNQPPLTLTSSSFSLLGSMLVTGPTGTLVNQSTPLIISNSTVHIVDSSFSGNQRFDFGGMVIMSGGAVTISNSVFTGLQGRVGGAVMVMNGSLVRMDNNTQFSSCAGSCLAGAVLVNSDSALYLDNVSFTANQANGDRGGGAVLLYGNSSLYASNSGFERNAATAANLYAVDAAAMASGVRPSDDAVPNLWCGAVGGVPGIDSLYGINDLASNHLLGGYSGGYSAHLMLQAFLARQGSDLSALMLQLASAQASLLALLKAAACGNNSDSCLVMMLQPCASLDMQTF